MIFAAFSYCGEERVGILSEDKKRVVAIEEILDIRPGSMLDLIRSFTPEMEEELSNASLSGKGLDLSEIKLLSPIQYPMRSVICLGKNYREHVKEVASLGTDIGDVPENPIYFEKMVDKSQGDGDDIPSHSDTTNFLDYEAELAIIIGKEGKNIPSEIAEDYIFGYTILNDVTARDIQKKHIQWFRGKSLDGTCPMGPWIVHKNEIQYPPKLKIECYVNGELRQSGNTGDLIFDIPFIISDFSKGITLKPGDIISTGTPSGVGMGFKPPKTLKAGDEVKCIVENIGTLTNRVI